MKANQIELLSILAEKIKVENNDRVQVIKTLRSAGILNQRGALSGSYSNLKKVVTISE